MKRLLLILIVGIFIVSCNDSPKQDQQSFKAAAAINTGNASGVPTFENIGLYWSASGQSSSTICNVQYSVSGSGVWKQGYPLWMDTRSIGGRPANEYRGSIVGLKANTVYDIQLSAGTVSNTFTVKTWNDKPNIASTGTVSGTVSVGGTDTSAFRLYTGNFNGDVTVNASNVIFRGCKFTGATNDAIVINGKNVRFEDCDVSGWGQSSSTLGGNNQAAFRVKFNTNVTGLVIQRTKIHNPRYSASAWNGNTHPYGVNGINLEGSGGNNVIRYNDIYSDSANPQSFRFMDGIGGADNFTYTGAPGKNSDIYGNNVMGCYDDAIEAEGGGENVRIYGNWSNYTFTGIATATVSIGPMYVFNNVSNVGTRLANVNSTEDRGPFNKCGGDGNASFTGGRTYLFHNTVLQPSGNRGLCGGIVDNGGYVLNVVSVNNIWTSAYTNVGGLPIGLWKTESRVTSTNDLLSPNSTTGSVTKSGTITSAPTYASTVGLTQNPAGYFLASGSAGKGKGFAITGFNAGTGVDLGAYHAAKLEFGRYAYLTPPPVDTTTPPPANVSPVAFAGSDQTITLPTNTVNLTGTGTDADGTISSYLWSYLSGPSQTVGINNFNSANATVVGLTEGAWFFRLRVMDDDGAVSFDDVRIIVNPAPVVKPKIVRVTVTFEDSTTKVIEP